MSDGEGAAIFPSIGGPREVTNTSTEQAQPLGQQEVGLVHFLAVGSSMGIMSGIVLVRDHCISLSCVLLLAFYYHEVGCDHLLPGERKAFTALNYYTDRYGIPHPRKGWRAKLAPSH